MKKLIAMAMSLATMCSMAGISANAEEYNESQIDIMEEYTDVYVNAESSDIVDRSINTIMSICNFSFIDNAWKDDSTDKYADAYTSSGVYIGIAACEYEDNAGTDEVRGSYYSDDYIHYCCTISQGVSSGLSEDADKGKTAYNSWINYGSGANVEVECFAYN